MFQDSIEKIAKFTRPVHSIARTYTGKQIIPGTATLFFVNEEGYAVTCKHVIELLLASESITKNYNDFRKERDKLPRHGKFKHRLKALEQKYKLAPEKEIQIKNTFLDCVDSMAGFTWHAHPTVDLAIVKFNEFKSLLYTDYAVFKKDTSAIKQGEFLCRLGFPFPEFTNFTYNEATDDIEWTDTGVKMSPRFPIEGMVTRFLAQENKIMGIELSTPGLKGQSGGPLFNKDGIIYGMQYSTRHLHLGFDLEEKEIIHHNKIKKVSDYAFLHLGQCIHVEIIKEFLTLHKVKFYEK
jgi:hypothetical protein